jgi:hypothetical protein
MPDLNFQIVEVKTVARGLTPLLHFKVRVSAAPPNESIHALLLSAQIQLQPTQRTYAAAEKEKLIELFGTPERWGQTLRNRLWAHSNATVGAFTGQTETVLPVPCSYDLNVAATKYFYGLESGEVSLLFLFSGSVFYPGNEGRLQVERISWSKECLYRMPVLVWQQLMDQHYPNVHGFPCTGTFSINSIPTNGEGVTPTGTKLLKSYSGTKRRTKTGLRRHPPALRSPRRCQHDLFTAG